MSDMEAIKNRVRKLMALANDGQASDGEIENAMRMAGDLIDKHHLDLEELTEEQRKRGEQDMGTGEGLTESSKFHQWETTLAWAICDLFGSVQFYMSGEKVPLRKNGIVQTYSGKYAGQVKMRRKIVFYGPVEEASEAGELYTEWCQLIATMGVVRWGGAYRGDGEAYCQGFAGKLREIAREMNQKRLGVAAVAPIALLGEGVPSGEITLFKRNEIIRKRGSEWLEKDQGIKLGKGQALGGSGSAGGTAYREGREHATQAGFGRSGGRGRKRLE